jgi:tRNA-intron endonuclease
LLENKESELIKNNKKLNFEQAVKLFTKETKDFFIKYLVFKELRKKGYIVKAGLKFGGEFRVYEQYNLNHAKYICFIAKNSSKIIWQDLISKIRVTHSTAKKLLIAIVDSEDDLLFYEMDWIKL